MKLYSEIIEELESYSTKEEALLSVRRYQNPRLIMFLKYALNENIVFDTPIPTYNPSTNPIGLSFTTLNMETPKLYLHIKDDKARNNMSVERRQTSLLVLLESLHKDEAALLVDVMTKKFSMKNLTYEMIKDL